MPNHRPKLLQLAVVAKVCSKLSVFYPAGFWRDFFILKLNNLTVIELVLIVLVFISLLKNVPEYR